MYAEVGYAGAVRGGRVRIELGHELCAYWAVCVPTKHVFWVPCPSTTFLFSIQNIYWMLMFQLFVWKIRNRGKKRTVSIFFFLYFWRNWQLILAKFAKFKKKSGTEIHHHLENSTCDPFKYTLGSSLLIVSICTGNPSNWQKLNPVSLTHGMTITSTKVFWCK